MTVRPPPEQIEALAAQADRAAGQIAALIAYVAHLPGAESVRPRDLRGLIGSLAPQRVLQESPETPFDAAVRTVDKISEMARQLAALRAGGTG